LSTLFRTLALTLFTAIASLAHAVPFDLSATKLGGGGVVRVADYRGQVVVVNLFAHWCPPCRMEMPDFEAVYEARKDRGLVILGMAADVSDPQDVQSLITRLGVQYPIGVLTQDQAAQLIRVLPTTVLLGTDGEIVQVFEGMLTQEQLLAQVDPLLPPEPLEALPGIPTGAM